MLFTLVLLLALSLARAAAPVPQHEHEIDAYVDQHATTLFQEFARAQIAATHDQAPHKISDETVQYTANELLKRVATKDQREKVRYLTGMQRKVEVLKAGI